MRHIPEGAEFLQNLAGEVKGAGALGAGAKENGQKLGIAQSPRAFLEQLLARPVIFRPAFDARYFLFFYHYFITSQCPYLFRLSYNFLPNSTISCSFFLKIFLGGSAVQYSDTRIPLLSSSKSSICSCFLAAQRTSPIGLFSPGLISYFSSHLKYSSICPLSCGRNLSIFNSTATRQRSLL